MKTYWLMGGIFVLALRSGILEELSSQNSDYFV